MIPINYEQVKINKSRDKLWKQIYLLINNIFSSIPRFAEDNDLKMWNIHIFILFPLLQSSEISGKYF